MHNFIPIVNDFEIFQNFMQKRESSNRKISNLMSLRLWLLDSVNGGVHERQCFEVDVEYECAHENAEKEPFLRSLYLYSTI